MSLLRVKPGHWTRSALRRSDLGLTRLRIRCSCKASVVVLVGPQDELVESEHSPEAHHCPGVALALRRAGASSGER